MENLDKQHKLLRESWAQMSFKDQLEEKKMSRRSWDDASSIFQENNSVVEKLIDASGEELADYLFKLNHEQVMPLLELVIQKQEEVEYQDFKEEVRLTPLFYALQSYAAFVLREGKDEQVRMKEYMNKGRKYQEIVNFKNDVEDAAKEVAADWGAEGKELPEDHDDYEGLMKAWEEGKQLARQELQDLEGPEKDGPMYESFHFGLG